MEIIKEIPVQNKERLLCLCFAYFMAYRNFTNAKEHFDSWISLFKESDKVKVSILKSEFSEYLEDSFNYEEVLKKYTYKNYTKTSIRLGREIQPHDHLVIAYNQIRKIFLANAYIRPYSKKYIIHTQASEITRIVKDECLKKLINIFDKLGSSVNFQFLSSVDFYIINASKEKQIVDDFTKNIINATDLEIVNNYIENNNLTYHKLMAKYFNSDDMIGISHKMPSNRMSRPILKLTGNIQDVVRDRNKRDLDPYMKLVITLLTSKENVNKSINSLIDIDYNNWEMKETLDSSSWKLFFNFNYKKLDPHEHNLKFALEPLPSSGSGSWNGKFKINTSYTPWVAGTSPQTLHPILSNYSGYKSMIKKLAKKRIDILDEVLAENKYLKLRLNLDPEYKNKFKNAYAFLKHNTKSKIKPSYIRIYNLLKQEKVLSKSETVGKKNDKSSYGIKHFFNDFIKEIYPEISEKELEKEVEQIYKSYLVKFCINIKNEGRIPTNLKINHDLDHLENYYVSLQMSYIFMADGYSLWLKRQIFFTLFGAITKRAIVGVKNNKLHEILDQKSVDKIFAFKFAPFILLT